MYPPALTHHIWLLLVCPPVILGGGEVCQTSCLARLCSINKNDTSSHGCAQADSYEDAKVRK